MRGRRALLDQKGRLRIYEKPLAAEPGWWRGEWWDLGIWKIGCGAKVRQPGKDANGRRRRDRLCLNDAAFMRWTPDSLWHDPLCTVHWRARRASNPPTPTKES